MKILLFKKWLTYIRNEINELFIIAFSFKLYTENK